MSEKYEHNKKGLKNSKMSGRNQKQSREEVKAISNLISSSKQDMDRINDSNIHNSQQ